MHDNNKKEASLRLDTGLEIIVTLWCFADIIPSVQFLKREKHRWRSAAFSFLGVEILWKGTVSTPGKLKEHSYIGVFHAF